MLEPGWVVNLAGRQQTGAFAPRQGGARCGGNKRGVGWTVAGAGQRVGGWSRQCKKTRARSATPGLAARKAARVTGPGW